MENFETDGETMTIAPKEERKGASIHLTRKTKERSKDKISLKLKDIGLPATLTLPQKFKEALVLMEQVEFVEGKKGVEILSKLTALCNDKKTTPKDIFDLFQF
jgi:hypothetical protein